MKITRVICIILLYILCTQLNNIGAQGVLSEKWVSSPSDTSYLNIIEKLESDYQVAFNYSPNILKEEYLETTQVGSVDALFDLIFTQKDIAFEIIDNKRILLYKIKSTKIEISGVVRDVNSKESIPAAFIIIKELGEYVVANDDGYFYIETENLDSITVIFNSIGYSAKSFVKKKSGSKLTIELDSNTSGSIPTITPFDSLTSSFPITPDIIKEKSAFGFNAFGLPDITQKIKDQIMVQNGNEGQSGFVVKGGSVDQNLILVDGMPIYDMSHIGGLSSIFITSAVKEVKLFSEGMPAEYGGKLSSVMDVKINEGNTEKFQGDFAIGLIGAEGHVEGPLVKDKTAISLSGRFNDLNFLSDAFFENFGGYEDSDLNFHDVYAKLHHKFSPTNRVSLTLYTGGDRLYLYSNNEQNFNNVNIRNTVENNFEWGNDLLSLQWNKQILKNVFLSTKVGYSRYSLSGNGLVSKFIEEVQDSSIVVAVNATSKIENLVGSIKFDVYNTGIGKVNFGVNAIVHNFEPTLEEQTLVNNVLVIDNPNTSAPSDALEINGFVENSIDFGDRLSFRGGLHFSNFSVVDTSYFLIEPRIKAIYKAGKHIFDLNITVNHQYVHFLQNPGIGLPSDIWVPSSKDLVPSRAQEVALGYNFNFSNNLSLDLQAYYKSMQGLKENIASSDVFLALIGDSLSVSNVLTSEGNWQDRIEEGRGFSAGIGGALKYDSEKFNAIVSYTYSVTKTIFPTIQLESGFDPDSLFFAAHNRPIDLLTQFSYKLFDNMTLSCKYVYGTGMAYTFPDTYILGPPAIIFATGKNNKTFPDFHHLDLNLEYNRNIGVYKLYFNFGLYNTYNRKNIFFSYLDLDENNAPRENLFGLLPRLPTFTAKISL